MRAFLGDFPFTVVIEIGPDPLRFGILDPLRPGSELIAAVIMPIPSLGAVEADIDVGRRHYQFKMFVPSVAVWELILRAAIIYVFVFVLLRMLGKKHVGEMAPFDLVILLILSEAVQNALVADDKSVPAAWSLRGRCSASVS